MPAVPQGGWLPCSLTCYFAGVLQRCPPLSLLRMATGLLFTVLCSCQEPPALSCLYIVSCFASHLCTFPCRCLQYWGLTHQTEVSPCLEELAALLQQQLESEDESAPADVAGLQCHVART